MSTAPAPDPVSDFEQDIIGATPSIDDVVAALEQDPVLIHPLFGNGARDEIDEALTAKVAAARDSGHDVYVALVPDVQGLAAGDDTADEFAFQLGRQLGDGFYFVATDPNSGLYSDTQVGEEWDGYFSYVPGVSEDRSASTPGQIAWRLDQLADDAGHGEVYLEHPWAQPQWHYRSDDDPSAFLSTFLPMTAAVAVTLIVAVAVRALGLWRLAPADQRAVTARPARTPSPPRTPTPQPRLNRGRPPLDALRTQARTERSTLIHLRADRGQAVRRDDRLALVDGSIDAAERILATHRAAVEEVIGALVLLRIAEWTLRNPGKDVYAPCFQNPLHGRGTHERTVDALAVSVPVCRTCARESEVDTLMLRTWRGEVPYFTTRSVWARTGYGSLTDSLWSEVVRDRDAR